MSKFSTKIGRGDDASDPVSVEYDFGEGTAEKPGKVADVVAKFGEDIVMAHVISSFTVAAQGFVRARMKAYLDKKEAIDGKAIQKALSEWKPGLRVPGKSKAEKIKDEFGKMSAEERSALLAALKAG